ncbi:iron (metal) dependent repressor, DtxR family [Anaerosphaera aminiphila DSM 21120]|uniref:Iron (Metal) dependent repressor, DtxR family n=1 Tax=Anaerosphaera aminiphila DSM 21120 TaxID=1120995 RepID=A0A1M5TH77_9FIRM|nr:iron (metal) dependent repressor, DtxR family [Anaerosphaera aminiphila DSM 21120]
MISVNSSRENYIQAIYRLSSEVGYTTNKEISDFFKISKSSASEMVKKLKSENYLEVENKQISLTNEGVELAEKIISAHRIWEYFLSEYLDMSLEEIHKQSDLLEHVTDDELLEKLNKFLNYPKKCPCGEIIYENK